MKEVPLISAFYLNFLIDIALIVLPVLYILYIEKKKLVAGELGFNSKGILSDAAITGKVFACLLIASFALTIILRSLQLEDLEQVGNVVKLLVATSPLILAYLFLIRTLAEEFFFRAFLVPRVGVVGSSIVFGLSHITYGSVAEVIGAIVLGAVLAHFYRKEKNIVANYVAHVLYNAVAVIFLVGR